jgi:hypothetical protein
MSSSSHSEDNQETSLPAKQNETNFQSTSKTSHSRRAFLGKVTAATVAAGIVGISKSDSSAQFKVPADDPGGAATDTCPVGCEEGPLKGLDRANAAHQRRISAADYEFNMPIPSHPCNGDESLFGAAVNFFASYSKGMPHPSVFGEVDPNAYCTYKRALASGKPSDFEQIPLGCGACTSGVPGGAISSEAESRLAPPEVSTPPEQRRLVNPQAGYNFDLEGKDYHQLVNHINQLNPIAFPPAFTFRSNEEAVEIIENYWQVLTRDVAFIDYTSNSTVAAAANELNGYGSLYKGPRENGVVTPRVYSRGILPGDTVGPYLSQFFLRNIPYGAQKIDPRIKSPVQTNSNNFMTTFSDWLSIQNGCTPSNMTQFDPTPRYIRSARDLAEYVHNDPIYQAYLNAALIMMTPQSVGGLGVPLDPNNPYRTYCRQDNFVEFGPSQLLTLLGEVSVRAHKAVWYQKWQVHRRIRPEEFGARVHFWKTNSTARQRYQLSTLLDFSNALAQIFAIYGTYFLPQAFPEGSPVHPAYGAGHATLAGACATILKAWFDESQAYANFAQPVQPSRDGISLLPYNDPDVAQMTIGTELNKLASNVAIGRNHAGVHWRSDYTESVFLGEQVAIQVLQDYGFTYNEDFIGFGLTNFDGGQQLVGAKRTS